MPAGELNLRLNFSLTGLFLKYITWVRMIRITQLVSRMNHRIIAKVVSMPKIKVKWIEIFVFLSGNVVSSVALSTVLPILYFF